MKDPKFELEKLKRAIAMRRPNPIPIKKKNGQCTKCQHYVLSLKRKEWCKMGITNPFILCTQYKSKRYKLEYR